jgi:hypothetical protein
MDGNTALEASLSFPQEAMGCMAMVLLDRISSTRHITRSTLSCFRGNAQFRSTTVRMTLP